MEDFLAIEGYKLVAEYLYSARSQCESSMLQLLLSAACGFHADIDLGEPWGEGKRGGSFLLDTLQPR